MAPAPQRDDDVVSFCKQGDLLLLATSPLQCYTITTLALCKHDDARCYRQGLRRLARRQASDDGSHAPYRCTVRVCLLL